MIMKSIGRYIGNRILEKHAEGKARFEMAVQTIPPHLKPQFEQRLKLRTKQLGPAYGCALLGGSHYLYLGNMNKQFLFWLTAGGFFCWWTLDIIQMHYLVEEANQNSGLDIIQKMKPFKPAPQMKVPAPAQPRATLPNKS